MAKNQQQMAPKSGGGGGNQQKKKSNKTGGNKRRVQNYWSARNQESVAKRKLRSTLRSAGPVQAFAWAMSRGVIHLLRQLVLERGAGGGATKVAVLARAALTGEVKELAAHQPTQALLPWTGGGKPPRRAGNKAD